MNNPLSEQLRARNAQLKKLRRMELIADVLIAVCCFMGVAFVAWLLL